MKKIRQTVLDGFLNVLTKIGVRGRDKRLGALPSPPINLSRGDLTNLYTADDIVARLCDLPAKTMTRKWLNISGVDDPSAAADVIAAGTKIGIRQATREAVTWGRLYGSALVIMGIDDGREMNEPVDESSIKSIDYLLVLDRNDLQIKSLVPEFGASFGRPETYEIINFSTEAAAQLVTMPVIHHTRVLRFDGVLTPRERRDELNRWNDSAVTRVYEAIRDFSMSYAGVSVTMQNLGTTIYSVKGLAKMLASDKDELLLQRLQALDLAKSVTNAVPVDADGESLTTLQQQFTGVDKVLQRIDQRLSAAIGWPVTVLMGRSPAGMNATGENDLAIFYDTMEGEQLDETPKLERFYRYLMLSSDGPTGGKELDGWAIKWNKLWQESQGDQAETRLKTAQADALNIDSEVYTAEEAANSHYAGDEFSVDVDLDEETRATDKIEIAKDIPGVDLRDPTGEGGGGDDEKVADEAMTGVQITALQSVLVAFNNGQLTQMQAVEMLQLTYQLTMADAFRLVGPEIAKQSPSVVVTVPPVPVPPIEE